MSKLKITITPDSFETAVKILAVLEREFGKFHTVVNKLKKNKVSS